MTKHESPWTPEDDALDMDRPNGSRLHDYFLGGTGYFPVDRDAGEEIARRAPHWALGARLTRTFSRRAVQVMASAGIDQFLDLGSGLASALRTGGAVHELARRVQPRARAVYVYREPISYQLGRHMVAGDPSAAVLGIDVLDPGAVLAHPATRELVDFDRPVGLLAVGSLDFVPDEADPGGVLRRYRDALAPGSMVALSHVADDSVHEEIAEEIRWVRAYYEARVAPLHVRTREEVLSWLDGTEILEPGFVRYGRWRPEYPLTPAQLRCDYGYTGVGRVL